MDSLLTFTIDIDACNATNTKLTEVVDFCLIKMNHPNYYYVLVHYATNVGNSRVYVGLFSELV